jgi:trehalose 6-phosphate phosphatase
LEDISGLIALCRSSQRLVIGLDRDGTLLPLEIDPDKSIMPEETRVLLGDLAKLQNVHVAIVSARGNNRLLKDELAPGIILAGNYGMEMRLHDGQDWVSPGALKAVPELRELYEELKALTKQFEGSLLEDDYYAFCLHWQIIPVAQRVALDKHLDEMKSRLTTVIIRNLTAGYEFMPNMPWSKGDAMESIAALPHLREPIPFFIYVGDADSDEAAFEWVNKNGGASVRVGSYSANSQATYRLEQHTDVITLLEQLLKELSHREMLSGDSMNL